MTKPYSIVSQLKSNIRSGYIRKPSKLKDYCNFRFIYLHKSISKNSILNFSMGTMAIAVLKYLMLIKPVYLLYNNYYIINKTRFEIFLN